MTKKQPMPFMKLYLSILDDPEYIELSRTAKSLYFEFYLLAWNADADGDILNRDTLKPLTVKNLALRLRTSTDEINSALGELLPAGLLASDGVTLSICRYQEEQDVQEVIREKARERQARSRERKKQEATGDKDMVSHVTGLQLNQNQIESNINKSNISLDIQSNQSQATKPATPGKTGAVKPASEKSKAVQPPQIQSSAVKPTPDEKNEAVKPPQIQSSAVRPRLRREPKQQDQPDMHKDESSERILHPVAKLLGDSWRNYFHESIDMQSTIMIDQAIKDGISSKQINDKLLLMVAQKNITNMTAYLARCLIDLYENAIENGTITMKEAPELKYLLTLK